VSTQQVSTQHRTEASVLAANGEVVASHLPAQELLKVAFDCVLNEDRAGAEHWAAHAKRQAELSNEFLLASKASFLLARSAWDERASQECLAFCNASINHAEAIRSPGRAAIAWSYKAVVFSYEKQIAEMFRAIEKTQQLLDTALQGTDDLPLEELDSSSNFVSAAQLTYFDFYAVYTGLSLAYLCSDAFKLAYENAKKALAASEKMDRKTGHIFQIRSGNNVLVSGLNLYDQLFTLKAPERDDLLVALSHRIQKQSNLVV
jgi:hypothetical protein